MDQGTSRCAANHYEGLYTRHREGGLVNGTHTKYIKKEDPFWGCLSYCGRNDYSCVLFSQSCCNCGAVTSELPTRNREAAKARLFLAASATDVFVFVNLPNCFRRLDRWMAKEEAAPLLFFFYFHLLPTFILFIPPPLQREKSRVSTHTHRVSTVTGLISDRPAKTLSEWLNSLLSPLLLLLPHENKKRDISSPFSRLIPVVFFF